jgi:hypothetical protein
MSESKEFTVEEKLKYPIPYKWKIQSFNKAKTKATCVAYIDARDVMDLLDKAVGIDGWRDSYRRDSNQRLICRLELNIGNGGWIGKEDTGIESDNEGEKGEFSDAFKRAAVKWGVGRFLYDLDVKYLDVKVNGDFKEYSYNGEKVNQFKLTEFFKKH